VASLSQPQTESDRFPRPPDRGCTLSQDKGPRQGISLQTPAWLAGDCEHTAWLAGVENGETDLVTVQASVRCDMAQETAGHM
jgi:hypothetical protein